MSVRVVCAAETHTAVTYHFVVFIRILLHFTFTRLIISVARILEFVITLYVDKQIKNEEKKLILEDETTSVSALPAAFKPILSYMAIIILHVIRNK